MKWDYLVESDSRLRDAEREWRENPSKESAEALVGIMDRTGQKKTAEYFDAAWTADRPDRHTVYGYFHAASDNLDRLHMALEEEGIPFPVAQTLIRRALDHYEPLGMKRLNRLEDIMARGIQLPDNVDRSDVREAAGLLATIVQRMPQVVRDDRPSSYTHRVRDAVEGVELGARNLKRLSGRAEADSY